MKKLWMVLFLVFFLGCEPLYTEMECIQFCINDPNQAMATSIVETARTEAATEAKIKLTAAAIEFGCYGGIGVCVVLLFFAVWMKSNSLAFISGTGILVFSLGVGLMLAKIEYPLIIAKIGLGYFLLVMVSFLVMVVVRWRAIVQIVMGNKTFLETQPASIVRDFKDTQREAQLGSAEKPSLTENLVSLISNRKPA